MNCWFVPKSSLPPRLSFVSFSLASILMLFEFLPWPWMSSFYANCDIGTSTITSFPFKWDYIACNSKYLITLWRKRIWKLLIKSNSLNVFSISQMHSWKQPSPLIDACCGMLLIWCTRCLFFSYRESQTKA
jgi:hypothetical protein